MKSDIRTAELDGFWSVNKRKMQKKLEMKRFFIIFGVKGMRYSFNLKFLEYLV
jgi:hypothetical protein